MRALLLSLFALVGSGCGAPAYDGGTTQGKQAILDATNIALSTRDCAAAIAQIDPLYSSANVDNPVRMARASAYACAAHVNFFSLLGSLATHTDELSGAQFWNLLTQLFPSSASDASDRVVEGAMGAIDAL